MSETKKSYRGVWIFLAGFLIVAGILVWITNQPDVQDKTQPTTVEQQSK